MNTADAVNKKMKHKSRLVQVNPEFPVYMSSTAGMGMLDSSFGQVDIVLNAASIDGAKNKPRSWGGAGALYKSIKKGEKQKSGQVQMLEQDWARNDHIHSPGTASLVRQKNGTPACFAIHIE